MPAFVGAMQEPQHRNGEVQSLRLSREKWEVASVVSLANGENSAANAREKLDVEDILKYPGRIQKLFYNCPTQGKDVVVPIEETLVSEGPFP